MDDGGQTEERQVVARKNSGNQRLNYKSTGAWDWKNYFKEQGRIENEGRKAPDRIRDIKGINSIWIREKVQKF